MTQVTFCALIFASRVYTAAAQEMPMHTTWTLHTEHRSWNEAALLCEFYEGHLANLNTTHKKEVMQELLGSDLWLSALSHGASVGPHNIQNQAQTPLYWLPGCDVNTVSFWPPSMWSGGCLSISYNHQWFINCQSPNEFICERQRGGACPYEVVANKKSATSQPLEQLLDNLSDEDCQNRCNDLGVDCWAAAYDASQRKCLLYKDTSPFFFDDVNKTTYDANYSMFIKRCYEDVLDVAPIDDWIFPHFPDRPLSVCGSNHGGRVYTIVSEAKNWKEARTYCDQIGQVLAGSVLEGNRENIRNLSTDYDHVKAQTPHWVNFELNVSTAKATWSDNGLTEVSSEILPWGSADVQCGALDVESRQFWTYDCEDRRAFLCVKQEVPCISSNCVWVVAQSERTYTATRARETTTNAEETTSTAEETTTTAEETTTTTAEETTSTAEETTTTAEETTTDAKETTTTAEEITSTAEETTTTAEETTAEETTSTAEETTSTEEETTSTAEETTSTAEETTTTAEETTSTAEETTNTVEETTAEETTTTAEETTTTAQETTTNAQETTTTARETTTTAAQTTTSVGDTTTSTEQTTTSTGQTTTSTGQTSTSTGETTPNTGGPPSSPTPTPVPRNTTSKGRPHHCGCRCKSNASTAPLTNDTQAYARHLIVPPNSTFKNRMRYVSAPDSRPSSVSMGITGIFFLSVLFLAVVVPDLCKLVVWLSHREMLVPSDKDNVG